MSSTPHSRSHRPHRSHGSHKHRTEQSVEKSGSNGNPENKYSELIQQRRKASISSADYDPLDDILDMFDAPHSLADLDQMMGYTNSYKLQLEEELEKKEYLYTQFIQDNVNSNNSIGSVENELAEMIDSFQNTRHLAISTGSTINDMTANIKDLDQCKKNLTLSMTILKRLQMLVTAYDQLTNFISDQSSSNKDYEGIKNLLGVVTELMHHFQTYKSIDDINTLNKRISSVKNQIVALIFEDFEKEVEGSINNPKLLNACEILDMLGKPYHDKLVNWYVNSQLKELTSIFKSTEEAGSLDNLKRRFIFFQRIITHFESSDVKLFPKDWKISLVLARKFCEVTHNDLKDVTDKETRLNGPKVDVNLLLNSLSETLDFESYLNQKFKYYDDYDERLQKEGKSYTFDKSISDVFEPYMKIWIEYQGAKINDKFMEFMNPSNLLKKSGVDDSNSNPDSTKPVNTNPSANTSSLNVLESAAELFRMYRQILNQLSKLSQGESLVKLSQIFGKYLLQYKTRILEPILPDAKKLGSSTMEENKEALEVICLILNTADYCSLTATQLENRLASLISPPDFAEKLDFTTITEKYLDFVNSCIHLLFAKIEKDLTFAWRELTNINAKSLKEVVGESRYVTTVKDILEQNCETIFSNFNRNIYVRSFVDRLLDLVLSQLILNYFKLKPISEIMAEQFLLDIQTLQAIFLKLPNKSPEEEVSSKPISKSPSFMRLVNNKFAKVEALLKILMVSVKPTSDFIQNYFIIIGDKSFSNFVKVLKLKGLLQGENSEKEKFKYMDSFKRELRIYHENAHVQSAKNLEVSDSTNSTNGNEGVDNDEDELAESNEFMESLKIDQAPTNVFSEASTLSLSPKFGTPTGTPVLQNIFSNNTANISPQINNFFNNLSNGGDGLPTGDLSPSNFKIDKKSFLNTRDQLEKNFNTFINSENKININENFKNFGKFFKKN